MKPEFALSLSFEGITLLHRSGSGWRHVGDVSLDVPDLRGELAALRAKARLLSDTRLATKLILPNDQIRYLSVETGNFEGDARREIVRAALEEATPYSVSELVFDISPEGRTTHVAAVARETLEEAAGFASEHKFNPVGFAAIPGEQPFLGEPWFGTPEGVRANSVEPDGIAVVVIGPAVFPEPKAEEDAAPEAPESKAKAGAERDTPVPEIKSDTASDTPAKVKDATDAASKATAPETTAEAKPDQAHSDESFAAQFTSRRRSAPRQTTTGATDPNGATVGVTAPRIDVASDVLDDGSAPLSPPRLAAILSPSGRQEPPLARPVSPPPAAASADDTLQDAPRHDDNSTETDAVRPAVAQRVALPDRQVPTSEAARMTVFGARGSGDVGGKPRHLGLILTAALLLFLAGVAAWASLFLDEGVAGLFGASDAPEVAAAPEPVAPPRAEALDTGAADHAVSGTDTTPAPAPVDIASLPAPRVIETPTASPLLQSADPDLPEPPGDDSPVEAPATALPTLSARDAPDETPAPELTDTDAAVLDALRPGDAAAPADVAPGLGADDTALLPPTASDDPEAGFDDPAMLLESDPDTFYAATGIWPNAPDEPDTPAVIGLDDLVIASIDRTDLSTDALALPEIPEIETDTGPDAQSSPAAAGTEFTLDARGLVTPTPDGTLTPDGILVYAAAPPVKPRRYPERSTPEDDAAAETAAQQSRLSQRRPRARPDDLVEQNERSQLGGLTRTELAGLRPRARPQSVQEQAELQRQAEAVANAAARAQASAIEERQSAAAGVLSNVAPASPADLADATRLAVVASVRPDGRPRDFAAIVERSEPDDQPEPETVAAATVAPRIPTSASVSRQATVRNAINLRQLNLIGVYGTPSNRRALIRLPSGRYKKVKVGDNVDGGRIVAIGDSELRYQKGGRNHTLKIPSS